jgi:Ca2+/Na+ antiporter
VRSRRGCDDLDSVCGDRARHRACRRPPGPLRRCPRREVPPGRSWIGVVLLAATTSLPELFTGFGATALAALPDIALGDVLGSCMFNLLILSMMDAVHPEPISVRAHQGHALSIGFGLLLIGVVGTD